MNIFAFAPFDDSPAVPNFSGPFATFAIGQPEIRRLAQPGDVVLGCSGQAYGDDEHAGSGIRWAGRVTEKLTFAQYWDDPRFRSKRPGMSEAPDNIYRWSDRCAGDLEQVSGNGVRDARHVLSDLSGRFVLIFAEFWDLAAPCPELPAAFGVGLPAVPGQAPAIEDFSRQQWWELRAWLTTLPIRPVALPTLLPQPIGQAAAPRVARQRVGDAVTV